MINTQYPFINGDGKEFNDIIKTYTDDENKVLLQVETGIIYGNECLDTYPCRYTYKEVEKPKEENEEVLNEE